MKHLRVFFALCAAARGIFAANTPTEAGLFDFGGEHVGLVEGTLSADGRYAAGWTVYPKKGRPPVDWSQYGKDGFDFREAYIESDGYTVTDVIVDLPKRVIAAKLQFTEPYFGGKNHGALEVVFGPEQDGHRYAIVLSDSKWEPNDVVLVDLAAGGATQTDIRKLLDDAVLKYVRGKHSPKGYVTDYPIFSLPETGLITGFADAVNVRVPFGSGIPKDETTPAYNGTVHLRLSTENGHPRAEVVDVRPTAESPNPVEDDPRIVAADKELNAAYTALRTRLDAAGKAKLLTEQRAWIKERDEKVAAASAGPADKSPLANPRFAADRLLLKLTQERTAVLRSAR